MQSSDRFLRYLLQFHGLFYLVTGLWALLATAHFLSFTNPAGNIFQAQNFAALSLIVAIYFLVGAWRADLLRPAAFLGLGSASAIALVELFRLPGIGWTLLWFDFVLELVIIALYVVFFFFRERERQPMTVPDAQALSRGGKASLEMQEAEDLNEQTDEDAISDGHSR